jgi:hypothetical protein
MKRQQVARPRTTPYKKPRTNILRQDPSTTFSCFWQLPSDLQTVIFNFATKNTTEKDYIFATKTVNAIARTNKHYHAIINEKNFSDNLIKQFSQKFYCSHEKIAQFLGTKMAKERLSPQSQLKNLYINEKTNEHELYKVKLEQNLLIALDELLKKDVDLDFTFDDNELHKTILMISIKNYRELFNALIKKNVNINRGNLNGLTPLHIAVEYPINNNYLYSLLNNPTLIINQQNSKGETALLHSLINRKGNPLTDIFENAIKELLKKGADPEIANNEKLTPLKAAQELDFEVIVKYIKNAIETKHNGLT